MKISEKVKTLPKKIKTYDLITDNPLEIELNDQSIQDFFANIKNGMLEENLIAYDNYRFRYDLRVRGRGEELTFYFEYMEILFDHIGPFGANILLSIHYLGKTEDVIDNFIEWITVLES